MDKRKFTVTNEHLKLLRRAYVTWNDCEFGAPSIDCKRPYGNSSVYQDIAEILGIPAAKDEDEPFTDEQYATMERLHQETQTVLQIVLATGAMITGVYEADRYGGNWERARD